VTGGNPSGPKLIAKERFDVAREVIRHQDGLVNNRVTWFLVLQGFLLNAFVGGMGLFDKPAVECRPDAALYVVIGLVVLALLGIYSSLVTGNTIRHAIEHSNSVRDWWTDTDPPAFPPVSRKWHRNPYDWAMSTSRLPYGFFWAWVLLLALFLTGVLS
jgi:hypothetical protein